MTCFKLSGAGERRKEEEGEELEEEAEEEGELMRVLHLAR
jgi:hypothetical protein